VAFAVSVVLLSCTTDQSKKLDVVGQINQDMIKNPSAAGGLGTNYYVCDDGDDNSDGLSEYTPWRSFSKGMDKFNSMSAGDSILFCRGGIFSVDAHFELYNFNCQVGNECTIGDYSLVDGGSELPIIKKGIGVPAAFYFKDPREADHEEGVVIQNLNIIGQGDGYGINLFNDIDDVELLGLSIQNFERGINNSTGNTPTEGSDNVNDRIILNGVAFNNNARDIYDATGTITISDTLIDAILVEESAVGTVIEPIENKVYYICDSGSDDNTGLSADNPWYSFSKVAAQFKYLAAGDTVAFCRGGIIDIPVYERFINTNCSAENPCIFKDYDTPDSTGNEPAPILKSTNDNGIFYFSKRENTKGEGIVVKNLELIGNGTGMGVFTLNGVSDVSLFNLKIHGFRVGVSFSVEPFGSKNISLVQSIITDNSEQGWLGGGTNTLIDGNYFENNGYDGGVFLHSIYISGFDIDNVKVTNNRLYRTAVVDGLCTGVALTAHGRISNIAIENNSIVEPLNGAAPTCYGIGIGAGYKSIDEWLKGVVIRNNTVTNAGYVSIGCASCVDVLIENNKISNSNPKYHDGIRVPVSADDSVKTDNVVIRGNYIDNYVYGDDALAKIGINAIGIPNLVIENNSVITDNKGDACILLDGKEYMEGMNTCLTINN